MSDANDYYANYVDNTLLDLYTAIQPILVQSDTLIIQTKQQLNNIDTNNNIHIDEPYKTFDFNDIKQQKYNTNIIHNNNNNTTTTTYSILVDNVPHTVYEPIQHVDTHLIDSVLAKYHDKVKQQHNTIQYNNNDNSKTNDIATQSTTIHNNVSFYNRILNNYKYDHKYELKLIPLLAQCQYNIQQTLCRNTIQLWYKYVLYYKQYKICYNQSIKVVERVVRHYISRQRFKHALNMLRADQYYTNRLLITTMQRWLHHYNIHNKYKNNINKLEIYNKQQHNIDYKYIRSEYGVHDMVDTYVKQKVYRMIWHKWLCYMTQC